MLVQLPVRSSVLSLTSTGNLGYSHSKFPGINVCGLSVDVLCSCDVVNVSFSEILQKAWLYSPGIERRSGENIIIAHFRIQNYWWADNLFEMGNFA